MDYTRAQRAVAWDTLSDEVREFMLSEEFSEILTKISKDNGLLLDKTSLLSEEINLTMLGLKKAGDFVTNIKNRLGITDTAALKIGNEVNQTIFLKTRQVLQEIEAQKQTPTERSNKIFQPQTGEYTDVHKDDILAEIENPTPAIHPISIADQTIAGPAISREVIPETAQSVARDFIGSKLTQTVNLPAQKASVTLQSPAPAIKPKDYPVDPYRESIN